MALMTSKNMTAQYSLMENGWNSNAWYLQIDRKLVVKFKIWKSALELRFQIIQIHVLFLLHDILPTGIFYICIQYA
jgi:hypothetical protein